MMDNIGEKSLKERHEAQWKEIAKLRMELSDMKRRAERAEGTVNSMIHELRDVLPSGFRGDNPVWACGKLADRVVDLDAMVISADERGEIDKIIISTLQGTIEDLTHEMTKCQGEIDRLNRAGKHHAFGCKCAVCEYNEWRDS